MSEEKVDDHVENASHATTYLEGELSFNSAAESPYGECLKMKIEKVNWEVIHTNLNEEIENLVVKELPCGTKYHS